MEAVLALESVGGHVRPSSRALALALALLIFLFAPLAQAFAARLGGAYYVDDAEIGKPGSCEIESWSSFAANGDRIAVFSPACVVNPGRPVEVGTNLVDLRSNGQEDVLATLTAKTVPIPIGRNGFGLAIAGAIVYASDRQSRFRLEFARWNFWSISPAGRKALGGAYPPQA
jgi:hypothetical protein